MGIVYTDLLSFVWRVCSSLNKLVRPSRLAVESNLGDLSLDAFVRAKGERSPLSLA